MADFLTAFNITAQKEGGYVNNPNDPGGETYIGISRKSNATWAGWSIIDANQPLADNAIINNPTLQADVQSFYQTNYWDAICLGDFTNQQVANFTFDWYVNSGHWSIKVLQTIVGTGADGDIGPETITAVNAADPGTIMARLVAARIGFYYGLVSENGSLAGFLQGWINRANAFA